MRADVLRLFSRSWQACPRQHSEDRDGNSEGVRHTGFLPLRSGATGCWVPARFGLPGRISGALEAGGIGIVPAGDGWIGSLKLFGSLNALSADWSTLLQQSRDRGDFNAHLSIDNRQPFSVMARLARGSSSGACLVTTDVPAPRITRTFFFIVERSVSDS
jgi:hypothetical protein